MKEGTLIRECLLFLPSYEDKAGETIFLGFTAQFVLSLYRRFRAFVNTDDEGAFLFFKARSFLERGGGCVWCPKMSVPQTCNSIIFMPCKCGFLPGPYDIMSRTC